MSAAGTTRALVCLVCTLGMLGCGSARRSEPLVGPLRLDAEQQRGEIVFFRFCHQCHPTGDAGLGPGINDKPLPGAAIRLQIRSGVGAMPSFDESEISDRDVDAIIEYLDVLEERG